MSERQCQLLSCSGQLKRKFSFFIHFWPSRFYVLHQLALPENRLHPSHFLPVCACCNGSSPLSLRLAPSQVSHPARTYAAVIANTTRSEGISYTAIWLSSLRLQERSRISWSNSPMGWVPLGLWMGPKPVPQGHLDDWYSWRVPQKPSKSRRKSCFQRREIFHDNSKDSQRHTLLERLSTTRNCKFHDKTVNFELIVLFVSAVKQISNWLSKWVGRIFQLLPQPPQTKLTTGKTKEKGKVENEMIETEFWHINISYFLGWLPAESQWGQPGFLPLPGKHIQGPHLRYLLHCYMFQVDHLFCKAFIDVGHWSDNQLYWIWWF